jgi:sentrin-specific protease 1
MEDSTSKRRRKRLSWEDRLAIYVTASNESIASGNALPKQVKKWAENQRYSYSRGGLNEEQIKLLNDLNFNWRLRNGFIANNNKAVAYCTSRDELTPRDRKTEKWMSNSLNKLKKEQKGRRSYSNKTVSYLESNKQMFTNGLDRKQNIKVEFDTGEVKEEMIKREQETDGLEMKRSIKVEFDTREVKEEMIKREQATDGLEMKRQPTTVTTGATTTTSFINMDTCRIEQLQPHPETCHDCKMDCSSVDREYSNTELNIITKAVDALMSFQTQLTKADVDKINDCMGTDIIQDTLNTKTEVELIQIGLHSLTYYDLRKLREGIWLNDEIVNWWMYILLQSDISLGKTRHSHYFSSFFVQKLYANQGKYCFDEVKRWSKNVYGKDIFQLKHVFFPININNIHWAAVVAHIQERRLEYYDSMSATDQDLYLKLIFDYLKDEHKATNGGLELEHQDLWQLQDCSLHCPKQENLNDCGVFTCTFAYHLATANHCNFKQDYVTVIRKKLARLALTMRTMDFITSVNNKNIAELIILKNPSDNYATAQKPPLPLTIKSHNAMKFPLHKIGPLNKTQSIAPPLLVVEFETNMQTPASPFSASIGKQLREAQSMASYNSGQGHFSDDRSFLSDSFDSKKDAAQYHNAIVSALSWLYSVRNKPTQYGLTQTIVSAITYLPRYYSITLRCADEDGRDRTISVDWAKVPIVDDSGYYPKELPASIPSNVRYILKLNNYYEQLPTILSKRTQEATRPRYSNARNFPPVIIYLQRDDNSTIKLDDATDTVEEDFAVYPEDISGGMR